MKRVLLSIIILAGIALAISTCKKTKNEPARQFKGKIISSTCGVFFVDIDQAAGAGQGETWTFNSVTYKNAAGVANYCYIVDSGVKIADSISFNISTTNVTTASNCAIPLCAVASNNLKSIYVTDVVKIK